MTARSPAADGDVAERTPEGPPAAGEAEAWSVAPVGPNHLARWVSVVVGVLLAAFVLFLFTRETGERAQRSPVVGQLVPPVAGVTTSGASFDIDDLRGQWVVVNFFAHWCAPCREEHPEFVDFAERRAATGDASVVSVAFDDDPDDARAFFEELGGDWPVLAERTAGIGISFGVTGVPETYLVAPDGTVVARWISTVDAATLDDAIASMQGAPATGAEPEGEGAPTLREGR